MVGPGGGEAGGGLVGAGAAEAVDPRVGFVEELDVFTRANFEATEGRGEEGEAVALEEAMTGKALDAAVDAVGGDGFGKIHAGAGLGPGPFSAALAKEAFEFGEAEGFVPKGEPDFAAGRVAVLACDGIVILCGGQDSEGECGLAKLRGAASAGDGSGEERGALDEEDVVPRVDGGGAFETLGGVGAADVTGRELADGGRTESGQPIGEKAGGDPAF